MSKIDNLNLAQNVVNSLTEKKLKIGTMESITGGEIISTITSIQGSSAITDGGYVTYSNAQKINVGVNKNTIEQYGVYSKETAKDMSFVAKKNTSADIGIGVTGSIGRKDPDNTDSVVGEVYYCIAYGETEYQNGFINVSHNERYLQKEFIVNIILNKLLKIINTL